MSNILVTGAAGFIGFHTAQALLDRGHAVVGVDNLNAYYDPALKRARLAILEKHPAFHFVKFDLADRAKTSAMFAPSSHVHTSHVLRAYDVVVLHAVARGGATVCGMVQGVSWRGDVGE